MKIYFFFFKQGNALPQSGCHATIVVCLHLSSTTLPIVRNIFSNLTRTLILKQRETDLVSHEMQEIYSHGLIPLLQDTQVTNIIKQAMCDQAESAILCLLGNVLIYWSLS